MINLANVTLAFGERFLFDHASCVFDQHKFGLVGRNGAGKSTLLKVIGREIALDSGVITVSRGKTIAYLPQELTFVSSLSIFDEACTAFADKLALGEEKIALEELLATGEGDTEKLIERYLVVEQAARTVDEQALYAKTREVLAGLGFSPKMQQDMVQSLSLGWRMRLLLAKLLLQDADFYLFDEPTNHLDIAGKEWFFNFLKQFKGGFLLVTHDRYFLDGVCERIVEVENGRINLFVGNFSAYLTQKELIQETKRSAYERQQRDIDRRQTTINRFRASASKSKMAQSMIKQLEKVELVEVDPPLPSINIPLLPITRSSATVLTLKNITFGYDTKPLFKNVNLEIARGQKIALVAPNGTGKTTLFNIVAGLLTPQSGSVIMGQMVSCALFAQDQTAVLNPSNTILEEISQAVDAAERLVRAFLGAFLFSGDDIHKKIAVLSGGEKNRVAMVKVFLKKANFLLLDEPTNHLDLYAKEVLCQALIRYEGTMFFVSHDQDFINRVATCIAELTPDGLHLYEGTYDSYMWLKRKQEEPTEKVSSSNAAESKNTKGAENTGKKSDTHKRTQALERRIAKVEEELARNAEDLSRYSFHSFEYQKINATTEELNQELIKLNAEWNKLTR